MSDYITVLRKLLATGTQGPLTVSPKMIGFLGKDTVCIMSGEVIVAIVGGTPDTAVANAQKFVALHNTATQLLDELKESKKGVILKNVRNTGVMY